MSRQGFPRLLIARISGISKTLWWTAIREFSVKLRWKIGLQEFNRKSGALGYEGAKYPYAGGLNSKWAGAVYFEEAETVTYLGIFRYLRTLQRFGSTNLEQVYLQHILGLEKLIGIGLDQSGTSIPSTYSGTREVDLDWFGPITNEWPTSKSLYTNELHSDLVQPIRNKWQTSIYSGIRPLDIARFGPIMKMWQTSRYCATRQLQGA